MGALQQLTEESAGVSRSATESGQRGREKLAAGAINRGAYPASRVEPAREWSQSAEVRATLIIDGIVRCRYYYVRPYVRG